MKNYNVHEAAPGPVEIWELSGYDAPSMLSATDRFTLSVTDKTVYVMGHERSTFTLYQRDQFGYLQRQSGPQLPHEIEVEVHKCHAAHLAGARANIDENTGDTTS